MVIRQRLIAILFALVSVAHRAGLSRLSIVRRIGYAVTYRLAEEDLVQAKIPFGLGLLVGRWSPVGRQLVSQGTWEPEITALVQSEVKEGDVFLDIGTNVGYYTLIAARPGRVLNVGSGVSTSIREAVATIESLMGRKARVSYEKVQRGDTRSTCADISRIRREVGFEPRVRLRDGLEEQIRWQLGKSN